MQITGWQWIGLPMAFGSAFLFYLQLVFVLQSQYTLREALLKPSNLIGLLIAMIIAGLSFFRLAAVAYNDT